jgi:hypothetical protein
MKLTATILAGALALVSTAAFAQTAAPAATARVRGTVEKLDGSVATIKTDKGQSVTLKLTADVAVSAVVKVNPADIKPGAYIGVGARPMPDGTLQALQVTVFPEAQRGVGEGHRDWSAMPQTTMTNGTVADTVTAVNGPNLTMKYKDGEKKLVIGPDAVVITTVPTDKADLKVGAELVTTATKNEDGSFSTNRVTVGKNGVAPPL